MDKNKEALMKFYQQALTANKETTPDKVLGEILADEYISYGTNDANNKEASIKGVIYFHTVIPDMKLEPQQIVNEGNQYVVRSFASGSPKGDFFGIPTDGTKSYKIMTIDILTIENGKILKAFHLEDWATAMAQLKA